MTNIVRKREAPWIGIGVKGEWHDPMDAMEDAHLDFQVSSQDAYWNKPEEPLAQVANDPVVICQPEKIPVKVNVRMTDNRVLGCVTDGYRIIQNESAFKLLEPFCMAGGVITNAGMTEQGLCFMVLRMMNKEIFGDRYDFDVMCVNSFNGKFNLGLIVTPIRIICQNMYRKLVKNDSILKLTHKTNAEDRLKAASASVGLINTYIGSFENGIEKAVNKNLTAQQLNEIIEMLFPYPKAGGAYEMTYRAKVDKQRTEFVDQYINASDNTKFAGTGMGMMNAYFDWLSHHDPVKNMSGSWDQRRLSGLVSGAAIDRKIISACI